MLVLTAIYLVPPSDYGNHTARSVSLPLPPAGREVVVDFRRFPVPLREGGQTTPQPTSYSLPDLTLLSILIFSIDWCEENFQGPSQIVLCSDHDGRRRGWCARAGGGGIMQSRKLEG